MRVSLFHKLSADPITYPRDPEAAPTLGEAVAGPVRGEWESLRANDLTE
ncbi:MAG: hypothetical protein IPM31_02160 [Anaerolineae bacterium]|nr:hypothetical protein [Anaerolineae bacterium]MBL8105773.1 hypothetical protein [Anaerolineales bacterium]MCC7190355.1 hypothetical protein [Anaerolineales bacterium]